MKKCSTFSLAVILTALTLPNSFAQVQLIKTTHLNDFASASAIAYFNKQLYVLGDDAPDMLILDNRHEKVNGITLFKAKGKRINKDEKPDIEASTIYSEGKKSYLIGFSSFSTDNRNKVLVYNLSAKHAQVKFKTINDPLRKLGIEETNIEGATIIKDKLVLSNRANNKHRSNYLIVTEFDPQKGIRTNGAGKLKVVLPQAAGIVGISGLEYVKEKDMLLFVASTEDTDNATEDGTIGDSYLGCISSVSQKLKQEEIQADTLLSFTKAINQKQQYKIESLAVESIKDDEMILHLVADNDDGKSTIFKIKWNYSSL